MGAYPPKPARRPPPTVQARLEKAAREIEQLNQALATRAVIARAQGILMERYGIDAAAAFAVLRRASSQLELPVREVAANLEQTRTLPRVVTSD